MATTEGARVVLGRALRDYVEARSAALLAARKALEIGDLDARALLFIVDHPATRSRDLGDYLGLSSAGTTTLTDRLVSRGVVTRQADELDRRVVRLTAAIDLSEEPWSALTAFDTAFGDAVEAGDQRSASAAAELIAGLTRSVRS